MSLPEEMAVQYYWLSDSDTFPGGTGKDYSPDTSDTVNLKAKTSYGNVTINAWFQDMAGNRSTAPSASAVYNYTASVSIQYAPVSSINVGATIGFTVDSATLYNWTITPSVSGVAEFQEGGITLNDASSVTVVGIAPGTFTVSAVPTAGGDTLTIEAIPVTQSTRTNTITLATGWNWVSFNTLPTVRTFSAFFGSNEALVQQVKTQTSSATNTGTAWLGEQTLMDRIEQGAMFKIKVSTGFTLTVTGTPIEATTAVTLNNGWTWIAFLPNADLSWDNAVAGVMSKLVQLKSQTQSKTNTGGGSFIGDLSIMSPGKGYLIKTSEGGTLTYPND
jgi:hypothetical protein